jgi:Acetyltransferase (GNAT) domain
MISVSISPPNLNIAAQWDDLVLRSAPNPFMSPAALKAACDTDFASVQMLLAWEEGAQPPRLLGLWALRLRKVAPLWPALLEALPYNYAFLSSPVVDTAFVDEVIPAFFAALAGSSLPKVLSLKDFDAESTSYAAVVAAMAANGRAPLLVAESTRPIATRTFGVKKSGSTRKKLRQDWNRLSALGVVDVVNHRDASEVGAAFETFLALEAASWKGAQGTALLSDAKDAAFVRRLLADLAARGDASVALLRLDGRALAAQVLMYCGTTAYTWKTAYHADYAKYSPGALLIDKVTEELFVVPGIDAIDSCSDGGGIMAQLWAGRRAAVDLLVDVRPRRSLAFVLEAGRLRGYHVLRNLRNRLRGSHLLPRQSRSSVAAGNATGST